MCVLSVCQSGTGGRSWRDFSRARGTQAQPGQEAGGLMEPWMGRVQSHTCLCQPAQRLEMGETLGRLWGQGKTQTRPSFRGQQRNKERKKSNKRSQAHCRPSTQFYNVNQSKIEFQLPLELLHVGGQRHHDLSLCANL